MTMIVAALAETAEGERRAALTPDAVARLVRAGHQVRVERGIGAGAGHADSAYVEAGAHVAADIADATSGALIVVTVTRPPASVVPDGALLVGMLSPLGDEPGIRELADAGVAAMAMELIPRVSRAQSMDVLSSMSTIAGYEAVLIGAGALDKLFPMLMTAAGTVAPARVFVIGAGVAGLQAIATARRLGAVVTAFDTRAAVREQVESLGAAFTAFDVTGDADAETEGGYARALTDEEQARQRELMADHIASQDVVITTALVPGRPAPLLIPTSTVERMRPGAVVVDLASETGGNCEVTRHGERVEHGGVVVLGPDNLPSRAPAHASQLYARNVVNLLELLAPDGELVLDTDDEIIAGTLATRDGQVVHPMLRERYGMDPLQHAAARAGGDAHTGDDAR